jgi:hypothetical protein
MMPDTEDPPLFFDGTVEEHVRKVALATRELLSGKSNNTIVSLTLTPNSATTEIEMERVCCDTIVNLTPKTASAGTALSSGTLWVEVTYGKITIHHDEQPDLDRTFGAVLVG